MNVPLQIGFDFLRSKAGRANAQDAPIDKAFPEKAANDLAARESFNKHLYRPNTYLHKWWARRSGTTFRHILKQLVADPEKRDYYESGGLEGKIILDPMMGGGTSLHEAIRMGANVIGVDLDPIPVLQAKATLTLLPVSRKKIIFQRVYEAFREKLLPLYRTTCTCGRDAEMQFMLYGLRRKCSCREVIFVDQFVLRRENRHDVHICPRCHAVYSGPHRSCRKDASKTLLEKGTRQCEQCHTEFLDILEEPFPHRYVPLVVAGVCDKHGQFFKAAEQNDLSALDQARVLAQQLEFGDSQMFRVPGGPKSCDLLRRCVTSFQDLYTPRQLIYLHTARELLSGLPDEDRLWMALLISTSLEFNSLLCGYKGSDIRRPGAIRHVFSHHAYSFPYTALENNPSFSGNTSGTLKRLFNDRIVRAGQWAIAPIESHLKGETSQKVTITGEVDGGEPAAAWEELTEGERKFFLLQTDAAALDIPEGLVDYVVTDPPYYDSVQYSDLSNFFRVWLRLFLSHEVDWRYNPLASAVSEGDASGDRKYGEVMENIWKTCSRALKKDTGRLIFTFHHWNHEAWAELTLSLKKAGFTLVNRYVVFSENPVSVHINGLNALKHDTILVLKPNSGGKEVHKWAEPARIDASDSAAFCRDCGAALGWLLSAAITEEYIRDKWRRLLKGDTVGKAPV